MPAGRPKKPISLAILDGSYRPDRHGTPDSIVRAGGKPEPPDDLPGEARQHWDRIVPGLIATRVASACDAPALEMMCRWWAEWRRISAALDDSKLRDDLRYHLLIGLAMASKQWAAVAARFGLTPSDRAKLRVDPAGNTSPMPVAARKR